MRLGLGRQLGIGQGLRQGYNVPILTIWYFSVIATGIVARKIYKMFKT